MLSPQVAVSDQALKGTDDVVTPGLHFQCLSPNLLREVVLLLHQAPNPILEFMFSSSKLQLPLWSNHPREHPDGRDE